MSNHLFELILSRMPALSRDFLILPDGKRVSYGDMLVGTGRMANALKALGVRKGDRVAVQVEKSQESLLLYLGCVRLGAVYLPLNTAYTMAELDYFVGDAGPSLIVGAPERDADLQTLASRHSARAVTLGIQGDGTFMSFAKSASEEFIDVDCAADDLAAILYTSGTTGRSKGAMLTHENLASNALALQETWRFTDKDVLLHALPIYHTHGLFVATNTLLLAGGSMIFLPKFDANEVMRFLPQATSMMGVPTFYVRLLGHPGLTKESAKHIRLFISGSAPLLAETHADWQAKTGHAILERYGMTETGMNTSNPYEGLRKPGTVGFALPGVSLRVVEPESGRPLPQGEIGMIEVKGPNVFIGYWRMPEKTRAEFRPDGFFITGDLGRIDEDGYVQIVGRGKDLVITGGFNVYPKEVEGEIDALEGVDESAVIGVAHPDFGEGVTAVVVPRKGASLNEREILGALESRLAKFKLPKRVLFVEELPRNSMGKVQKNVLRDTYASLYKR
jgi:malonyl-CoA/methylmalonyl-CoA synthetase